MKEVFGFETRFFENYKSIEDYIDEKGDDYGKLDESGKKQSICMGVIFNESEGNKFNYNLYYNLTGRPDYRDLYGFDNDEPRLRPFEQENERVLKRQTTSGAFQLINYIDQAILRLRTNPNA
jgi:hypothetical protein